MEKIKEITKKFLTKEVIAYLIFGILTTIVNLLVSFILNGYFKVDGAWASAVGIIAAVLFAYFTNRKWVFNTKAKGFKENIDEFVKFILGRAVTMIIEQGGVILFYSYMQLPFMPVKLALTVIVVILNFFFSKFFVFTKDNNKGESGMKKITAVINKYINVIIFVLTIFIALGMNIGFVKDTNFLGFNSSDYTIFYLMEAAGVAVLLYYSFKIKDKRLWRCTSVLAFIFAVCYLLGDLGNTYFSTTMPNSKKFVLYIIIKIFTYFILFNSGLVVLFNKIPAVSKVWGEKSKEYKFFTANKKSFFVIALIFFISYIPYFLYYYPGLIQYDAVNSLEQIVGFRKYANYNPVLYTLFLGGIWNLGKAVFGTGNAGIALYIIVQMILTSLVLSFMLYYMAKKNISLKWRLITFLLLLFNPLIGMYVIRVEKSLIFSLLLILVIIGLVEIIIEKKKFFDKKWKPILYGILLLISTLFRHNGIYVLLLTVPFILIVCKGCRKATFVTFIISIIAYFIIQGPIFSAIGIIPGRTAEMFSIPMQQLARIVKYEYNNLSQEEKENIYKYIPNSYEKMSERYDPLLSDNIKADFSEEQIKQDKISLVKLYFHFALKYPGHTISAFLFNTYGYYAPNSYNIWGTPNFIEETEGVLDDPVFAIYPGDETDKEIPNVSNAEKYDIHLDRKLDLKYINSINNNITMKTLPVFSMFISSIGLYFWMLLACATYCIYTKKYNLIVALLPILWLWLTSVAGPVVELRYVYTMLLIMPLYIGIIMFSKQNVQIDKEKK